LTYIKFTKVQSHKGNDWVQINVKC
jgi:hypothetical protein